MSPLRNILKLLPEFAWLNTGALHLLTLLLCVRATVWDLIFDSPPLCLFNVDRDNEFTYTGTML